MSEDARSDADSADAADAAEVGPGTLADNVMHFARVLRRAGLPVGSDLVRDALCALGRIDLGRREDLYWALATTLLRDHSHHELFHQAFRLFFRDPRGMESALAALLPQVQRPLRKPPAARRVHEALHPRRRAPIKPLESRLELDAAHTYSAEERLRSKDFAEMSADELRAIKRRIARMELPLRELRTRRYRPDPGGPRIDPRATLRAATRAGTELMPLRRRRLRTRPPSVVALCDISGSMERYSEVLLHFLHALTGARERVHAFVFGTRLSNISRQLRHRDIDVALTEIGQRVQDWASGTRIGVCLEEFHRDWTRRVLGQDALLLLITDGLDRDSSVDLGALMERLHRSCRRLMWLNPLLRYHAFEPRARGIRAMLPHVDDFCPVHDLRSLEELCAALEQPLPLRRR
ncbi:vWA domain-containing protein [Haliangium ochraceum]|uniref:VWA containing CoxE family protein n=1 Tax=Haliangium ochraceum (strain DSM 14365 / JCM 11303 / SMP-2) TaxID=502025 RepID=D0LRH5_HALO1|nr:VWA domain-containing protein [Haliangium ochraceum]ACY17203.1 VWA containing CoxE family protein [Haliangium ochraceum DSM 14365]